MNDRIDRPASRLFVVAVLLALAGAWLGTPALGQPPGETTVLRAARILDGRGAVLEDRDLVVRDGRIAGIVPRGDGRGDRVYDLSALTVLPVERSLILQQLLVQLHLWRQRRQRNGRPGPKKQGRLYGCVYHL